MKDIWTCKIGEISRVELNRSGSGLDLPMRKAVCQVYKEITGRDEDFIFSGWGSALTEAERAVVENRMPHDDNELAYLLKKQAAEAFSLATGRTLVEANAFMYGLKWIA